MLNEIARVENIGNVGGGVRGQVANRDVCISSVIQLVLRGEDVKSRRGWEKGVPVTTLVCLKTAESSFLPPSSASLRQDNHYH